LTETAVYWGNPVSDGAGGRTFDDPIELTVRWEGKQELFRDAAGKERMSRAIVYVSQAVDLDAYLYLGTLDDLSSAEEGDPFQVATAWPIRMVDDISSLDGAKRVRTAWL
jgi:hypothetical protein